MFASVRGNSSSEGSRMDCFRQNIERMEAYVPGQQPAPGMRVAKLNTNENPYPPSPKVAEALRSFDPSLLRRYGDAMASDFREAIAGVVGVPAEWILPSNGSDDLIVMISRACLGPGRRVAFASPSFGFYTTQALVEDAEIVEAPYDADFRFPLQALIDARAHVTFVANPDSPSGTAVGVDVLEQLARGVAGLLVVDEAYCDFCDVTALDLVRRLDNVMIIRTLSKGYSLAGLRMGYGIARPHLMAQLLKTKQIYNVDTLAAAVATAAVLDQPYKIECARRILASRAKLAAALARLGWDVVPSQANFLLVRAPEGYPAPAAMVEALKARGILVRYFSKGVASDRLRITVGSEEENALLLDALQQLQGSPA